jgi:hypothetical protein
MPGQSYLKDMQRGKNKSNKNSMTLKGIPAARRHFYFYTLLVLIAVVGNRAIKSDSGQENNESTAPGQKSHAATMAENTRLAYR